MFHLAAFSGSLPASTSSLTNIAPVQDPSLRTNGNFLYVPTITPQLLGYYALGQYATQFQFQSPSLRQFALLDVSPINASALPDNPLAFSNRFTSPYALQPNEALQALATNTGSTGGQATLGVWFGDGPIAEVSGPIITVRFTATDGALSYGWNNETITLSQNLPVGQYTCVGARVESADVALFRFYPVGSVYRPGFIAANSVSSQDYISQRYGRMGNWFDFDQLVLPSLDTFSTTGGGSIVGYMDLVKKS